MNLGTIWDIIHAVTGKESRGNVIKPDEFTSILQQCHIEYYNQQYEKWAVSQTVQDSLRPFVVVGEYQAATAGVIALSDMDHPYRHMIAARSSEYDVGQTWFNLVDIVTPQQYVDWSCDPVMRGSATYPMAVLDSSQIQIFPFVDGLYLTYLAGLDDNITSAAVDSTATSTTPNKLVDSGQTFTSSVSVGMKVCNTTDSTTALITAIDSATTLSLDTDIMASGEDYQIIQADAATNYYLPFFDYYIDSNDQVQYIANASFNTLTANDTYRDGTAGDGSRVFVGLSHELKWGDQDKMNIVSLLLQKIGVNMSAPELSQYAMALQQQQNVA